MKIYIASSWKNQHGVEMLTSFLRERGHHVVSWIENSFGENVNSAENFEKWVWSAAGGRAFKFDTNGAATSDLVIYYGPAGKDACAEIGIAWAKGIPIIGLFAKGEDIGLMRRCMDVWAMSYMEVLDFVSEYEKKLPAAAEEQI